MKQGWGAGIWMILAGLALAGCNLSADEKPAEPTAGTAVGWVTVSAATAMPTGSAVTLPTPTAAPTLTSELTVVQPVQMQASQTSLPSLTPTVPGPPPSFTPAPVNPLMTNTPVGMPISTSVPTATLPVLTTPAPLPQPTVTTQGYGPPPTFTPVLIPQTPVTPPPNALVCSDCQNLRLRESPGTVGRVITQLPADVPLTIIGRTADNAWAQVVTADGLVGWVAVRYLVLNMDMNTVGIAGVAMDVPTAVAVTGPGGIEVVSGVSSHARQIFLDGLTKGNLPHSFTRVGDSITAAPQFLTQIGEGRYNLGAYGHLQNVISFFSGPNGRGLNPFSASSMAAQNGWGTTSILDPANADPNLCRSGETPLECEYRLVKPSVALIMIGTNDSGGLPSDTYRANLQRIVQISINMGVIPVLSTIPPKHYDARTDARVDEFNQIIIATARAYDIPLWNYWLAMRNTPAEGLSSDGVHPSSPPDGMNAVFDAEHLQYGFNVRNLTALQMLYALWQQVLYDADQAVPATAPPVTGPGGSGQVGTAYECPGSLPPLLTVGGQGRVTPGLPNKLRSEPSTTAAQVGSMPGGAVFSVIGGPRCADGMTWWQVNYNGQIGWTANGSSSEYWVEPY